MLVDWRGVALVLAVLAAVVGLCALNLHCGGGPSDNSTLSRVRDELATGRREQRYQQAENLAALARDLRVLAARYREAGENKKAQRAIGAAQELDRKIAALRNDSISTEKDSTGKLGKEQK